MKRLILIVILFAVFAKLGIAQIEDILLNSKFRPTTDSTKVCYRVRNVIVNNLSLYEKFLPDSAWIDIGVFANDRISILRKDLEIVGSLKKNRFGSDISQNKIDSIPYTNGNYSMCNKKGKPQATFRFDNGYLTQIIYYNAKSCKISEIYDFSSLYEDKDNVQFFCYSSNWNRTWDLTLVTIDPRGFFRYQSMDDKNSVPTYWKRY